MKNGNDMVRGSILLDAGQAANQPSSFLIVLLSIIAIGTWIGVDWYATGPQPRFALFGAPGILWHAGAVALVAAFCRLATPRRNYRRALVLVLAAAPFLILINYLLLGLRGNLEMLAADHGTILLWLSAGLVLLIASRLVYGRLQWLGVLFALAGAAGFFWIDDQVYVDASLWYPPTAEADDYQENWERAEQLLFSQPGRIDKVIERMEPGEGPSAAYFVGFAGYAEEKVFAEEIKFAAETLGERYDSRERMLLLLNDARSSEHDPIASVSGLQYGLNRIAEKMDRDNDLLILAMSSHGSSFPSLAVSNGVLPLRDLDSRTLKALLDGAGIKWRVLIVSACYAGAFIDALADPYSAIITSAAPDRTSFGCSNDRDLTYFGAAFYRDALPRASTLREAFEMAKSEVVVRERQAGFEPSNPKAFFGEAIEDKLLEYSRLLPRQAGAPTDV